MRNGRAITTIASLTLVIGLAAAPGAWANAPGTDTLTPETSTSIDTSAPSTETSVPTTSTPVTEVPTTEVPTTEVPKTETPEPETPTCENTPALAGCTPDTPEVTPEEEDTPTTPADVPDDAPAVDGDGTLPFTGPGDVVLAVVLALLAGTGGMLFLFGASSREAIEGLRRRDMSSPSGFKLAYRELLKQQMDD